MLTLLMLLLFEVLCYLENLIRNEANTPPYLVGKRGQGWRSPVMRAVACMQPWFVVQGARAQPGQHHAAVPAAGLTKAVPTCTGLLGPGIMPRSSAISSAFPKATSPCEDWCCEQAAWGSCWGLGWGRARLHLLSAGLSSSAWFWPP